MLSSREASENIIDMKLISLKAGMENVDMKKINELVVEASKGSNYYIRQQEKQVELSRKIEEMKHRLSQLTDAQKRNSQEKVGIILCVGLKYHGQPKYCGQYVGKPPRLLNE